MRFCPICAVARRVKRWARRRRPLTPQQQVERDIERLNRYQEQARRAGWRW